MKRPTWNALTQYQSIDLIKRAFEQRHGRVPNSDHAWEIAACFIQANEYFANASAADVSVRPLLLYYGVHSLSRGATLFLSRNREANLKPSHGLRETDWGNTLAKPDESVLDLTATIELGAFQYLAGVLESTCKTTLPVIGGSLQFDTIKAPPFPKVGERVTLGELLAREPALHTTYVSVARSAPGHHPGQIVFDKNTYTIYLMQSPFLQTPAQVREVFGLSGNIEVGSGPLGISIDQSFPHFAFRLTKEMLEDGSVILPAIELEDFAIRGSVILPTRSGRYFPPELRCFATAYFLGMLVRYFPSEWIGMVRNRKRDAEVPLLRETLDFISETYPDLILSRLTSTT